MDDYEAESQVPDPLELREVELLEQIRDGVAVSPPSLALTDESVPPVVNANFPVPGQTRQVVPRKATGGLVSVPSLTVPTLVLAANSERSAGSIVNCGSADVFLILAPAEAASGPAIGLLYLVAKGGSWDMRLGPPLWCGSVSALARETSAGEETFSASQLAVTEV